MTAANKLGKEHCSVEGMESELQHRTPTSLFHSQSVRLRHIAFSLTPTFLGFITVKIYSLACIFLKQPNRGFGNSHMA